MPVRIQRRRVKGWKMPASAVYVGRPSIYGNPFRVGIYSNDAKECAEIFDWCVNEFPVPQNKREVWRQFGGDPAMLIGIAGGSFNSFLRGKDLCCWCREGGPCHADTLLRMANK
jgi:hypothetical protein